MRSYNPFHFSNKHGESPTDLPDFPVGGTLHKLQALAFEQEAEIRSSIPNKHKPGSSMQATLRRCNPFKFSSR